MLMMSAWVAYWTPLWTNTTLVPWDHALIYASSYFPKPLSWQTLLLFQIMLFIQISAKIYFWGKAFIKTKYLQIYLDLQSGVVPLFLQTFILLIFIKGFQTPLRKLYKGDVYVSICFWNHLLKPYSFFWNCFLLDHGLIITEHWFNHCSDNARLAANDWPCVVSCLCMTVWLWWVACVYIYSSYRPVA
jgi:hypothetical protein